MSKQKLAPNTLEAKQGVNTSNFKNHSIFLSADIKDIV
jgi:hypothetical protein